MQSTSYPALVLNADFRPLSEFPLSVVGWQDAVSGVFSGRVAVVAEYDAVVRSPTTEIRLPSVIALRKYRQRCRRVAFTRLNVFLRDRFTCQYCGAAFRAADLTFDHVVPRALGGVTSWQNVVAACGPCNSRKGDRLKPLPRRVPSIPTARDLAAARKRFRPEALHQSWLDYVYWDSELDA